MRAPGRPWFVFALLLTLAGTAQAQALAPGLAERFSAGVAALEAGRLEDAERTFRAVLHEGGDRSFVHHNLGIALQRRGRHAAAVAEFRLASRQDPTFGPARLLAGASLLALGQPGAAIPELERAIALMPRELAPRLQLADACERTGDVPRLVDTYRAIAAMAPDEPEYTYRLGKAYLRLSQWSFTRLRAIDPQSARLSQALGREYLQQGEVDLARAAFEQAVARDPTLPDVHLALARLHADARRWEDAAREVERELALVPDSRAARELGAAIDTARRPPPDPQAP
jgi:tetratricopeptide (TPR) repeat protein